MTTSTRLASWLAALALLACSPAQRESAPAAAADQQAAPVPDAVADAVRPNRVLDPNGFRDPTVRAAYAAAKQFAHVLEEIYCYCKCRENIGHRALIECFESDHGSHCDVCITEAITVARMTQQGKTPSEIQKAIDAYYAAG